MQFGIKRRGLGFCIAAFGTADVCWIVKGAGRFVWGVWDLCFGLGWSVALVGALESCCCGTWGGWLLGLADMRVSR